MTIEYILYAIVGLLLTSIFSVIGTRAAQAWGETGKKAEILIKEHEARSKINEDRIEKEMMAFREMMEEIRTMIHEVRTFVAKQMDKNDFATQQFGLLWEKHNENRKDIDNLKERVSEIEHKEKYGTARKNN